MISLFPIASLEYKQPCDKRNPLIYQGSVEHREHRRFEATSSMLGELLFNSVQMGYMANIH